MDEAPVGAEGYDFERLAREIVASRLKDLAAPAEGAGAVAREIIISAVQSTKVRQDPHLTVTAAVRGVMSGLLLIEKPLVDAAVEVLQQANNIAQQSSLDPTEVMTWALEGIAQVAAMAPAEAQNAIHEAIEHKYMGAGGVYNELLAKAAGK